MRESPRHVSARQVLEAVRSLWAPDVTRLSHLPDGSGAQRWTAYTGSRAAEPILCVTLDGLLPRHSAESLEAAYAAAAILAADGLDFVLPPLPGRHGRLTAALGLGALSATRWRPTVDAAPDPGGSAALAARLHAATAPVGIPRWQPVIAPDLTEHLAVRTSRPWTSGPYGERARRAVRVRLDLIEGWAADYHRLAGAAGAADAATWVPTHGEPGGDHELTTVDGVRWVDWASLKLAPRERDLARLPDAGHDCDGNPALLELFDLEWRLDEICGYADRLAVPHTGTADDRIAFDGLMHELTRPPCRRSRSSAAELD